MWLLSSSQEAELAQQLAQAEAAGRSWNSVHVAAWMSAQLGHPVRAERGRDVLQRLGYSTKTPRTRHAKAEQAQQDEFEKACRSWFGRFTTSCRQTGSNCGAWMNIALA